MSIAVLKVRRLTTHAAVLGVMIFGGWGLLAAPTAGILPTHQGAAVTSPDGHLSDQALTSHA